MSAGQPMGPEALANPADTTPAPHLLRPTPPKTIPTFSTLLVVPFSTSTAEFSKSHKQGRAEAQGEIRECFSRLLRVLEGKGLKVTSRRGRGAEGEGKEVWVFVGVENGKIDELAQKERQEDFSHGVNTPATTTISHADQIRLLYSLLTSSPLQGGLGITPGEGEWKRVKSIAALHDEQVNYKWIQAWTMKKWYVGFIIDKESAHMIREHFGDAIATYFSFLSFYTTSLVPISLFGVIFWMFGSQWSWVYALGVALWGLIFVEIWKIKERKIQTHFSTTKAFATDHLRPQYLSSLSPYSSSSAPMLAAGTDLSPAQNATRWKREMKVLSSIPVIVTCGAGLGGVLTGIFVFEAFLSHLYDGPGKQLVSLAPTVMFATIVPNVIAAYHTLTLKMTNWENHPTNRSFESSLTVKTFAMNAIVAYLGLFLSAYVYVPFGEIIMDNLSVFAAAHQHKVDTTASDAAGLAPGLPVGKRVALKGDRLVNQLFAVTVTNQAINAFTELALPFIMRKVTAWRNNSSLPVIGSAKGQQSAKVKKETGDVEMKELDKEVSLEEKKFLDKVERELALPQYSLFVDYAEMVTQFGYITLWSIIWPIAPVMALINNYVELRSDAVKICSHVRRPIAERGGRVGVWVDTMTFLTWLAALTNSTLIYLFRPSMDNPAAEQCINPNVAMASTNGATLARAVLANSTTLPESTLFGIKSDIMRVVLPSLLPVLFVALAASHAFLVVRWLVNATLERALWIGSLEETMLKVRDETRLSHLDGDDAVRSDSVQTAGVSQADQAFWRGTDEGVQEIERVLKVE